LPLITVFIKRKARKHFDSLPKDTQDRAACAIRVLRNDGLYGDLDIKQLKGLPNAFRIRVGDYRIFVEFTAKDVAEIYAIKLRKNVYK
jgi:mRNA-degrading endonuclease RelE of RelBE toxin-antitoxin system